MKKTDRLGINRFHRNINIVKTSIHMKEYRLTKYNIKQMCS